MSYDVIIIGAGPAGLSAALWCAELGLKTRLLEAENEIGGQLLWVYNKIENHLGAEAAQTGRELRDRFVARLQKREFDWQVEVKISSVSLKDKQVILAGGERLMARALILATGIRRRKLGIIGENDFKERGVLESGKRDADRVAGKIVCVVGGGDAACENALILAETAKQVYLIHRRSDFRARREFLDRIQNDRRIKIFPETEVVRINGGDRVESIELRKAGVQETFQIFVDAILIRIGVEPNTELFREELQLDADGYVKVNSWCETNVANVLAIGDVADSLAPTISGAVGNGATAAKVVIERLRNA